MEGRGGGRGNSWFIRSNCDINNQQQSRPHIIIMYTTGSLDVCGKIKCQRRDEMSGSNSYTHVYIDVCM